MPIRAPAKFKWRGVGKAALKLFIIQTEKNWTKKKNKTQARDDERASWFWKAFSRVKVCFAAELNFLLLWNHVKVKRFKSICCCKLLSRILVLLVPMFYHLCMSFPSIFKVIFWFMAWHKLITKPDSLNSYFNHLFSFKHFILPNYWVSCNDFDVNMYFWTYMKIKDKAVLNGGWNLEMTHAKLALMFHLFTIIFVIQSPE